MCAGRDTTAEIHVQRACTVGVMSTHLPPKLTQATKLDRGEDLDAVQEQFNAEKRRLFDSLQEGATAPEHSDA